MKTTTLRKRMSFCSFASLVGGACGPSPESPEVDKFVYLKDCDRDVRAHLKLCKILTNIESIDSERKLLLMCAGKCNGIFFFWYFFLYHCTEKRLLLLLPRHFCSARMSVAYDNLSKTPGCVRYSLANWKDKVLCARLTASNLVLFFKKRACLSSLDHVSID